MITFESEEALQRYVEQALKARLRDYPILEFDPEGKPKIDPMQVMKGRRLPGNRLVLTFFPEVVEKLLGEGRITYQDTIEGENPLTVYRFTDSNVMLAHGNVGCPACAGDLECLWAMGIDKVLFCGGGGVLDPTIGFGELTVVEGAIRDEGFSFQYLPPSRVVHTDEAAAELLTRALTQRGIPHRRGLAWTTDALFRETPRRIEARKAEGACIVEMEQAGCIAVAQCRGITYGAILYGGDDVSGSTWDKRGWGGRQGLRYDLVLLCRELVELL